MEPRNEIAVELKALSELLWKIGRTNPYTVPDGYFDRFPAGVLSRLVAGSPTFQVPPGYFEGLAAHVLSRVKNEAAGRQQASAEVAGELAGLSATLATIGRLNPYRVPEGYFEDLSPILVVARENAAYRVPDEYFEELSPVLSVAAEQGTPYRVPEGYFDALPGTIAAKVVEKVKGRVLKGNWWKYSSAAAIAACLLLIFSWPRPDVNSGSKKPVTAVNIEQRLQNVSDQELEAYLDDEHSFISDPAANSTATLDMNEGEVKNLLGEVSDNDLQQYMEQHGKGDDLATN
ncbi:MAG TPA: hypothetical protein VGR89_06110 [Puia sp.]|nr:hypothetical protein [Puia sp.]